MAVDTNLSQVERLLRDAILVHDYSSAVGGIDVERLMAAINAVEALDAQRRLAAAPEVEELRKQYALARKKVPFDVFYSLRNGWLIFPSWRRRWITAGVVLLAIAFMICVLHLTRIYNRGVDLSAELTNLEVSQAERRYGELERKLLDAGQRLFEKENKGKVDGCRPSAEAVASACTVPQLAPAGIDEQYLLAREASHLMVFELVNLDQRIKDMNVRMGEFQSQATYPIFGMESLEYAINRLQASMWTAVLFVVGCPAGSSPNDGGCVVAQSQNAADMMPGVRKKAALAVSLNVPPLQLTTQLASGRFWLTVPDEASRYATQYDPRRSSMSEVFCRNVDILQGYAKGDLSKQEFAEKDAFLGKVAYSLGEAFGVNTAKAIIQNCALGLNYFSGAIPDIEATNLRVKDKLDLYSMIVLPAVYGALGAIVYFMRPLLNPRLPNPGVTQTVYRIALGALVGMIMAWLGMGIFGTDDAFKSIGLGLFAFAFILGFSIDVFFELLDRLVGISRGAVKRIGTPASEELSAVGGALLADSGKPADTATKRTTPARTSGRSRRSGRSSA